MSCMLMMVIDHPVLLVHLAAGQAGVLTTLHTSPEESIDIKYNHSKNVAEPKLVNICSLRKHDLGQLRNDLGFQFGWKGLVNLE